MYKKEKILNYFQSLDREKTDKNGFFFSITNPLPGFNSSLCSYYEVSPILDMKKWQLIYNSDLTKNAGKCYCSTPEP